MPANLLEVACFNLESAIIAQVSGAGRIELCVDYNAGGITPPQQLIMDARAKISIPLHVIIRPRGGGFVYSEKELNEMKASILVCKEHKIDGVVLGVLTHDKTIDTEICSSLITSADSMSVTFHRAIDQCYDLNASIQQLIDLGVSKVLTSGGADSALNGLETLKKLQQAFGKHITIMPGGGVRAANITQLMESNCTEYHSAAMTTVSELADAEEIKKINEFLNSRI